MAGKQEQSNLTKYVVTPSQLSNALDVAIKYHKPLMVTSSPGCGKTAIIEDACKRNNVHMIVFHPVVDDPTDYKGMPAIVDGRAIFLPFDQLEEIIKCKEELVAFGDDFGQAPNAVQAAWMQLVLARRINGHHIGDNVTFITATNRRQDRAGVSGVLEPVKGRFTILELAPDEKDWIEWGRNNGQPMEMIYFIRWKQSNSSSVLYKHEPSQDMTNSPNPRNVAEAGEWLNIAKKENLSIDMLAPLIAGRCGGGFANEFITYLRMMKDLPNVNEVLSNPNKAEIPKEPSVLFALLGALAANSSTKNFNNVCTYANRLSNEFSTMLVKDCVCKDPDLAETESFSDWSVKHRDIINWK